MHKKCHTLNSTLPEVLISLYPQEQLAFLDIETSGFSTQFNQIINLGVLYYSTGWQFKQYWAGNKNEEAILLQALAQDDRENRLYICYNGKSFDFPFINGRLAYHNINHTIPKSRILDFLPLGRACMKRNGLSSYSLKTIEQFLNINRSEDISGAQVVDYYQLYQQNKTESLKAKIMDHNAQDVMNMPILLQKLSQNNELILSHLLPVVISYKDIIYCFTLKWSKDILTLKGSVSKPLSLSVEINGAYSLFIKDHSIVLKIPILAKQIEGNDFTLLDWDQCFPNRTSYNSLEIEQKLSLVLNVNNEIQHLNLKNILLEFLDYS